MTRPGSMLCPVIVGRDDLLERIDLQIAELAKGRGSTLFLAGSAGLGKTRLLRAAIAKATAAGIRIEGGMVAPHDQLVPLASIRDLAVGARTDPAWGTLGADLLAIDGAHDGDALGSRRLIVRGVADRILEAIDRPSILMFDDLHWTDEMSLEVIGELARRVDGRPLLLIVGYRPDEFPAGTIHREWRARVLSQRLAQEVRLEPLTIDETAVATTLILGGDLPASRDVVEAVYERTNGIPLHVEELLGALAGVDRLDGQAIRDSHVPDTISDAVLARLDRLSSEARLVARAGAVVGRCFSPDAISGMIGRPIGELEGTLDELVEAAILRPFNYIDDGYYDFRHQLLRDAIYGSLAPSELRRYHAQAAEFVMNLHNASVSHASRHYDRAGLRQEAFRSSLTAAQAASRVSARHEAYELYERAIANMPSDLPVGDQAELYERLSDAAAAIERNAESAEAAEQARRLYLEAGRPLEAATMLLSRWIMASRSGVPYAEVEAYLDLASRELEALPETPDREQVRGWLLGRRASDRMQALDLVGARADALAARALAEAADDREGMIECDLTLARIDIVDGRYETGLRDGMRAARLARESGFEAVGVTGYRNMALMAARILHPEAAEIALNEGLLYADAIEQSHCRQMMATTAAILDWGAGAWDAADERARHELVDRGCVRGTVGALDVIGLVALGRGDFDEARRWLGESLAAGRRIGEVQLILTPLWGLAETDLATGATESAVARCEEALASATGSGERALLIPFVVTGVRALLASRRPDDAERWVARTRAHLAGWEPIAGAALNHAEGLIRMAGGTVGVAREALERAVRGWDERSRIWEATAGRLDLAQCLMRANRFAEAMTLLAEARRTATNLRSTPLLARVDELARSSRGRGTEEEPWRPLTVREFEVARLIADGMTNAEIADALAIAPKTASSHVEHILAKLGVMRRAEIAAWTATVSRPAGGATGAGAGTAAGAEAGAIARGAATAGARTTSGA